MKKLMSFFFVALVALFCINCKTTMPVQVQSSADVPDLTEQDYKNIDTQKTVTGIYFYNGRLGAAHVEMGDMTLKAFKDVMDGKVKFYKINLTTFSPEGQRHVADKVIGEPTLPSYIFIYKNNILAKKVGGYDNRESATTAGEALYRGFQEKVWRKK